MHPVRSPRVAMVATDFLFSLLEKERGGIRFGSAANADVVDAEPAKYDAYANDDA